MIQSSKAKPVCMHFQVTNSAREKKSMIFLKERGEITCFGERQENKQYQSSLTKILAGSGI